METRIVPGGLYPGPKRDEAVQIPTLEAYTLTFLHTLKCFNKFKNTLGNSVHLGLKGTLSPEERI
eukprot:5814225-Amphidinium_carterae.1